MNRRAYPRIRYAMLRPAWVKLGRLEAPRCSVIGCGHSAHYLVEIATSGHASEDERAQACPAHKGDPHALLTGIAKHQADLQAARKAKTTGGAS